MSTILTEGKLRQLVRDVRRTVVCDECEPRRVLKGRRCPTCNGEPAAMALLAEAEVSIDAGDLGEAHWFARVASQNEPKALQALIGKLSIPDSRVKWYSSKPVKLLEAASAECDDPELLLGARARVRAKQRRFQEAALDLRRLIAAGLASRHDIGLLADLNRGIAALADWNRGLDAPEILEAIAGLDRRFACGSLTQRHSISS